MYINILVNWYQFTTTSVAVPLTTNLRRATIRGTIVITSGEGGLT
jgi:mRNA interferase MazF